MTVSMCVLTYNRREIVRRSLEHNLRTAGRPIDEVVWVDNGSTDGAIVATCGVFENAHISPVVHFNPTNLGVAKGTNMAYRAATGDYIVDVQCDTLMPNNWLATFCEYFEKIPDSAVACVFCEPIENTPERIRGPQEIINGLPVVPCLPMPFHMVPRKLITEHFGYNDEGFGLYGWDDVAWAETALVKSKELGLRCYHIPGMYAAHLGWEGHREWFPEGGETKEYWEMKHREATDPAKGQRLAELRAKGWPPFFPKQ